MKSFSYTFILLYEKYQKRCWACGSTHSIKWGKQSGKQRYKCKNCEILFTLSNDSVRENNLLIWFKKWVVHYHTFELLSKESGYSISTLQRYFYKQLSKPPLWKFNSTNKVNLLIDATYFSNKICLVLYRDNSIGFTQLYRLTDGEWFEEIMYLPHLLPGFPFISAPVDRSAHHHFLHLSFIAVRFPGVRVSFFTVVIHKSI